MKTKIWFLFKTIIISLALFSFWRLYLWSIYYHKILANALDLLNFLTSDNITPFIASRAPYYFLAFTALLLATPRIEVIEKLKVLLIATLLFFLFDLATVFFGIASDGEDHQTWFIALSYRTILLLAPFLLWLIPFRHKLGWLLSSSEDK